MAYFGNNKSLVSVFESTMDFFKNGKGKLSLSDCEECISMDPEMVDSINLPDKEGECKITVTRNDSFGAVLDKGEECLVLNFMSAWTPGGGVKKGSTAQEEDLCRRSSLYLSLTSAEGHKLYDYNHKNCPGISCNYMLLSPNVEIIKFSDGEWLDQSVKCAVLSAAAPRLCDGYQIDPDLLENTLQSRIRGILQVAAKYNYKHLVLGAWGCGVYHNDPKQIARIFHDELMKMTGYFESVEFAVCGKSTNYQCFCKEFSKEASGQDVKSKGVPTGEPEYHFFYGHDPKKLGDEQACFSQWYHRWFTVDGHRYNCMEQYMMSEKARLFKDKEMLIAILGESDQAKIKAYGRQVKGFDPEIWHKHCIDIVFKGNYAKFTQNEDLKQYLLATGDKVLVEASPTDTIWGIGMRATAKAKDHRNWRGQNLLGYTLTRVKQQIMEEESLSKQAK